MNIRYYIALGIAALGLNACQLQDDLWGKKPSASTDFGVLTLDVVAEEPVATKAAVNTDNFPIQIKAKGETQTEQVYNYTKPSDFPSTGLSLPVGTYIVSSHTPGELQAEMTTPYFQGEQEVEISKNITTQVEVNCKMKNTRIEVALSDEFSSTLSEWEMTINDGINEAISFSSKDNKRIVYYYFKNEVSKLNLNLSGKLKDTGAKIYDSMVLTKKQASEKYDDASEYFEGGESLKINLKLSAATEGKVTFNVTASILFTNHDQEEKVDVYEPSELPSDPGSTPTPEPKPEGDAIVFSEPTGNSYLVNGITHKKGTTPPSNVQINMTFKHKLSNLYVLASSSNSDFATMLGVMGGLTTSPGLDLTSQEAKENGLNKLFPLPENGADSYSFTLDAQLFVLMEQKGCPGTHTYTVKAVDKQGNEKTATLKVTIVSDTEVK